MSASAIPKVTCNVCHKGIGFDSKECHMTVKGWTYILCEECYSRYKDDPEGMLAAVEAGLIKNRKEESAPKESGAVSFLNEFFKKS